MLRRPSSEHAFADAQADMSLLARDVAQRGADQPEEVALDPLPREVVGNAEDERIVRELRALGFREPRLVRRLVERSLQPTRNLAPEVFRSQLDWPLHARRTTPSHIEGGRA